LLVTSVKDPSIYGHVHRVLGHPEEEGMQLHREHTTGANYTKIDAARPRPLCRACVVGTMRKTATDYRRTHRVPSEVACSQFTLDASSHGSASYRGFRYGDIFTDINTGASYAIMTKDRNAEELCLRSGALFDSHSEWMSTGSDIDRFIRVDPELSYQSIQFMQHTSKYG
jgi:hypothetical protein